MTGGAVNLEGHRRRKVLAALSATWAPWAWAQHRISPWSGPDPQLWLQGPDQQGQNWSLRQLVGRAVVVNFWATWCPPCVQELPSLQLLSESQTSDLVVLTVNVKEGPQRVQRFMQSMDLTLPTLFDRRGEWTQRLGISTLPSTLLINAQGRTSQIVQGEVNWVGPQALGWIAALKSPSGTRS